MPPRGLLVEEEDPRIYAPVRPTVLEQQIRDGLLRAGQPFRKDAEASYRSKLSKKARTGDQFEALRMGLMASQDLLGGAAQAAGAPITSAISTAMPVAQGAWGAVKDTAPGREIEKRATGILGAWDKATGAVSDATGYPKDYASEAMLTGLMAATPAMVRGAGKIADGVEGLANRAGYTFRPQEGVFFSGVGPIEIKNKRGIVNAPDLRQMTQADAIDVARGMPHLIQDKSGQYVGAPRGVRTLDDLIAMRAEFDRRVAQGASGGQWYQRARDFVEDTNSPSNLKLSASELALMSAQANPDTNLGWAINLRNAYNAGLPAEKMRTGAQARTYRSARDSGSPVRLGKKTGVYGQHLDPTVPPATTGTNDIWHARSFGYTSSDGSAFSRALTPQEHRFLDYETMLGVDRANQIALEGRTNWTAAEGQAAPWVGSKGAELAKKSRGKMTLEEGIAEAGKTYPDYAGKYVMSAPREEWPSEGARLFPNWDMSKASLKERQDWMPSLTPRNDPVLRDDLGMYVMPTQRSYGSFMGQNNPVDISGPMTGFEMAPTGAGEKGFRIPAHTRAMMDMDNAVRGLVDTQDGSAWHRIVTHGPGKDKSSASINAGRPLSLDEMKRLEDVSSRYGLSLSNAYDGASLLDLGDKKVGTTTAKKLKKGLLGDIREVVPGASVSRGRLESGYFDLSEELKAANAGQGRATQATMKALDELKGSAPAAYEKYMTSANVAARAKANLERILRYEQAKGPAREDIKRMLSIISKDRLAGLKAYVEKYGPAGLPAVALVLGDASLRSSSQDY
jgi:hypothetical protein